MAKTYQQRIRELHAELKTLRQDAELLAEKIGDRMVELEWIADDMDAQAEGSK